MTVEEKMIQIASEWWFLKLKECNKYSEEQLIKFNNVLYQNIKSELMIDNYNVLKLKNDGNRCLINASKEAEINNKDLPEKEYILIYKDHITLIENYDSHILLFYTHVFLENNIKLCKNIITHLRKNCNKKFYLDLYEGIEGIAKTIKTKEDEIILQEKILNEGKEWYEEPLKISDI